MKKIYNIPVYKDAERISAYMEGNLSEEDRIQLELEIQNNPELAELAKDDIFVDWDADISDDYPGFDWQKDGELDELMDLLATNDSDDPFDYEDVEDNIDTDDVENYPDGKQEEVNSFGNEGYTNNIDNQGDDDDPSDDEEIGLDDDI